MMKPRTQTRSIALQALYEIDITGHAPGEALQRRLEETPLSRKQAEFARQIVVGVLANVRALDAMIADYAPEWPVEQIAPIDRNILRIAAWEFAIWQETPVKVAINEAVELAKAFGADHAPRFVNGVLGSLAAHIDEIKQKLDPSEA